MVTAVTVIVEDKEVVVVRLVQILLSFTAIPIRNGGHLPKLKNSEVNRLCALQKENKRGVGAMKSDREKHAGVSAAQQQNTGDQFALANKKIKKN
jgi:hypothetical protein